MMKRVMVLCAALGALAACQPAVPDSGAGVGFDNSIEQQRARDAALAGNSTVPAPAGVTSQTLAPAGSAQATAAQTTAVLDATRTEQAAAAQAAAANSGVAPLEASPSNPTPGSASISDENSFGAVSSRETIQSDAQRIAANRARYQVIQPEALPDRPGDTGPNVVAYALKTTHPVGTQLYKRFGFNKAGKYNRSCSQYQYQDQAQIDFLAAGGPEKDRRGMDPDGDGYACTWDPAPYRLAAQAAPSE